MVMGDVAIKEVPSKKPWMSKTLWLAVFTAIAAFFPPVESWIGENPTMFTTVLSAAFFVLRWVTQGKVSIE